jgi:hypothetical protein
MAVSDEDDSVCRGDQTYAEALVHRLGMSAMRGKATGLLIAQQLPRRSD